MLPLSRGDSGAPVKNQPFLQRLGFAFSGMASAFRAERSVRVQVFATAVVLGVLVYVRPAASWWALITLAVVIVLAAELFNTAVEELADHLHPQQHARIKIVKDLAAAAVLAASLGAIGVGVAFVVDVLR